MTLDRTPRARDTAATGRRLLMVGLSGLSPPHDLMGWLTGRQDARRTGRPHSRAARDESPYSYGTVRYPYSTILVLVQYSTEMFFQMYSEFRPVQIPLVATRTSKFFTRFGRAETY